MLKLVQSLIIKSAMRIFRDWQDKETKKNWKGEEFMKKCQLIQISFLPNNTFQSV